MIQVVDDQLLSRVIRGNLAPSPEASVFTTGLWYVRLCQAVLGKDEWHGALSSTFEGMEPDIRKRALASVHKLPERIGLVSLRELGPVIGRLRRDHHRLNVLGMEALAAAVHLQADVLLSTASPNLEAALRREGLAAKVVA